MSDTIEALVMPQWGTHNESGTVVAWLVNEGDEIAEGDEIVEVETEKITGPIEAELAGLLRRRVAAEGDVVPVGGLLAVFAPEAVPDAEIDAFVERAAAGGGDVSGSNGSRSQTFDGPLGPMHAIVAGDGPDRVVLLHGFGGDVSNWTFTVEPLAKTHTTMAVDLPGHGASTRNVGAGTLEDLVSAVEPALGDGDRAHLVGHSLGGLVAGALAARRPDAVASLTLIAPAGLGDEIDAAYVDGFIAAGSPDELEPVLAALYADPGVVSRQLVDDVLRYKREDGVAEALAAIRGALFADGTQSTSIADDLADLDVPVMVLWGAEDGILSAAHAASAPARARVTVLPATGHSPHVEAADDVNALLAQFLSESGDRG